LFKALYNGVASFYDMDFIIFVNLGAHVCPDSRDLGQGQQHVQLGHGAGCLLYPRNHLQQLGPEEIEDLLFKFHDSFLCVEHFEFVFLQIFGDVPFSVDQCLLPGVMRRDLVLMRFADLNVITEDPVVPDFEPWYACLFPFPGLDPCYPFLAGNTDGSQLVEFFPVTDSYRASVLQARRR